MRQTLALGIAVCLVFSGCLPGVLSRSGSQSPVQMPTITPILTPTSTVLPTWTPSPTPSSPPTRVIQTGKDAATFISESYPDYSVIVPGENFIKTWTIKNVGQTTWYADSYRLKLASATNNEMMGSPTELNFPHDVASGEVVTISIPMIAPSKPGTYAVYFSLVNDRAQVFGVDGDKIWALIRVCETGKACTPPQTTGTISENGVTASLTNFDSGSVKSVARFCLTLPDRNYGPSPASVSLVLDGRPVLAATGGSLDVGCFEFEFPVTDAEIAEATSVAVSINQVRLLGGVTYPQAACESARARLAVQYPGLDFNCQFSHAGYYTDLKLPDGLSAAQADSIIVDAIEGVINGPWILKVK